MDSYINSVDFFKGNKPEDIAAQYGTPLYVYNEDILRNCMRTVKNIITKYPYTANFSIKANSNLHIIKIAIEEGLNCDAVSINEAKILLHAGQSKEKIFFVPNNVSEEELQEAIDLGIMTALDSLDQLERYGKLNKGGRCAIRLNPGVGAGHHEKVITAGKNTKFAIVDSDLDEAIAIAKKYDLKIVGICQHVGSLFMDPTPFLQAVKNLLYMAKKFDNLEFIDFGGGYGVPYHKLADEQPFDFEGFSKKFEALLDEFISEVGYTPLFKTEPGRYVACESCVLLGRIHATKNNAGKKFAGSDIGMTTLVRPSLYDSHHDIEIIRDNEVVTPANSEVESITVTGNICESGDILCKDRELPVIKTGDLIAVLDAGAYGYSMCSEYNSRFKPAEVLITSNGDTKLIRRRQTLEDLLSLY
ncbi:MAG: diaminopimelate decarboxylase [Saccharofermentans sp.]|nr:diaminopimelate decarboxylase [Saccharofermentans sp.]